MKKSVLRLLSTLLFATFTLINLTAQSQGNISGKIFDENDKPLEFANALLLNPKDSSLIKGALTDSMGQFLFPAVPYGEYLVAGSMVGYPNQYSAPFVLNIPNFTVQSISFGASDVKLNEIVVRAARPFIELKANKIVMNVESSPVSAGDNALELLRKAPGVLVDKDNVISLRGKQGVLIMIDGKQTYLSQSEVVKMLEGTPSNSIDQIEVIMNPSAKYDAAGNAGIINIKMKKDKNLGFNGGVNIAGGTGRHPFGNGGVRFNYRQKGFNVFGNVNGWYNKSYNDNNIMRNIPFEGLLTTFDQKSERINQSEGLNYRVGADWFLSKKTTVGVLANGSDGNWGNTGITNTLIGGDNTEDFSQVRAENTMNEEWANHSFNVNVKHEFGEGKELTFDADYSMYDNLGLGNYDNFYFEGTQEITPPYFLRSNNNSDITIQAAKLDYSQPLNKKSNLEMGLKSSIVSTDNQIAFEEKEGDVWMPDVDRTDRFQYQEDIHAAYVNYSQQFEKG